MLIKRKAQGILEYTIMLAAIVAIIVVVMTNGSNSVSSKVKTSYGKMGDALVNTTTDLTNTLSPGT